MRANVKSEGIVLIRKDYSLSVNGDGNNVSFRLFCDVGKSLEAKLGSSHVPRFMGAVFCAAYGIDGFNKEIIGDVYIERDRIRVRDKNGDRFFVKVHSVDFFSLLFYAKSKVVQPGVFSVGTPKKRVSVTRLSDGISFAFSSGSVKVSGREVMRLGASLAGSLFGRYWDPEPVNTNGGVVKVYEVVELHPELKKSLEKDLLRVKVYAREKGENPNLALRKYLRAMKIPYSRKVAFSYEGDTVLIPLPDASYLFIVTEELVRKGV